MKRFALPLLALLAFGIASVVPSQAQTTTVVNPRIVEFDPSADHAAVAADGQPLVQRYELRIFTLGNTQPYTTTDLGKPSPETDGKIRVDFSTRVSPWPPDGTYEARVAALGPSGLGISDPSNSFSLVSTATPACSYTLSPQSLSLAASPGTSPLTMTTGSTCAWTATSNASWVTPGTPSGTGPATLSVIVSANTATTARTATLTIAGRTVTVTQAAPVPVPCVYTAAPSSVSIGADGGAGSVNVTAGSGCAWTAASEEVWASVSPASASGAGQATITVARNSSPSPRTTTVFVARQAVTVTQAGAPAPAACSYSILPATMAVTGYTQTVSVGVTSGTGCTWTASTGSSSWITLVTTGGTGSGTVSATLSRNSSKAPRTGTVVVAGQTCTITQAVPPSPSQPKKPRVR